MYLARRTTTFHSRWVTKNNTDAKWAARVIDLYKADKGISRTSKKQATNTAADFVPTKKVGTKQRQERVEC